MQYLPKQVPIYINSISYNDEKSILNTSLFMRCYNKLLLKLI